MEYNYDNFLYPYTISDEKLKSNIKDLDSIKSLIFILSIQAKSFLINNRNAIGFIAQDVEKHNKHCVISNILREKGSTENSFLSLSYNDIFIHCTNSIKSLIEIIETQNNKIDTLSTRIDSLEKQLYDSDKEINNDTPKIISTINKDTIHK